MQRRQFLFLLSSFLMRQTAWPKEEGQFAWLDLTTKKYYGQMAFGRIGSLAKLITAHALLQNKIISEAQTYECRQVFKNYNCQIPHGKVNLEQALGFSCNIYFAQAALKLSFENLANSFKYFTNKALIFNGGQIADYALGLHQNTSLNSWQILNMMALIAQSDFNVLQKGMQLAVHQGTAKNLDRQNILQIAAKTGTILKANGSFESWVAGYFPRQNPKYCFCLKALNGTSQEAAIPLAHKALFAHKIYFDN